MQNRSIKKLLAAGCVWFMLGCSQHCGSDSLLPRNARPGEAVFNEILQSGKREFFAGRYSAALERWNRIDTRFPFGLQIDTWRARALLLLQQPDRAYELLAPYLQLIPDYPELLLLLGKSQFARGNYTAAVELLERGAACAQGVAGIYLTRAEMYYHIGLHSRAAEYRRIAQRLLHLEDREETDAQRR
jgi:tetratricopeptide (TPR) repeat protein